MKRHNISFIIFAALLAMTSCSKDFLQRPPKGSLNESTLGSAEGAELLCTAAYGALHSTNADQWFMTFSTGGANGWLYSDVRSDIAYKGGGGIADCSNFHAMEVFDGVYPQHEHINGKWFNLYCAVQRAQSALRVLNSIPEDDWSERNVRIGEMKFLRAMYFFDLQRIFNRIPYFDENVEIGDYVNISNVEYTRDELLGLIAEDFTSAASLLPDVQKDKGRATRYAALAMEAKVNLYRAYRQGDDYSVTEIVPELLEKVVELCGKIEGKYSLLPDFQQLDQIEYDNGAESLFEIQFSVDDGTELNRTSWMYALCSPCAAQYAGCGFFQPSQSLVNSYRTGVDGLPMPDNFNDVDIMTREDGMNNNVDPRLDFVVGRPDVRWKTYTDAPYAENWVRDATTYGKYSCKRHLISPEDPRMWNLGMCDLNWKLIRYADVLLWKAEALIELGRQDDAVSLINEVRRRARDSRYVTDWNDSSVPAAKYVIDLYRPGENCTWTQEYARKALRMERKLELAMEGERFFDLVRWGVAADVMNAYFEKESHLRPYMGDAKFTHGKDEYLPIPSAQIELSHDLYQQNPRYNN